MNIEKNYQINIANITIEVIKKGIKNLHIAVYPPIGRVRIAAPEKTTDEAIRLFGISKLSWIKKNKQKYLQQERENQREYVEGESLMYKGKRYVLKLANNTPQNKIIIKNKKYIEISSKTFENEIEIGKQYENWLREELKEIVKVKITKWEKVTKLKVKSWKIQKMKTRWGSCNKKTGNILINFELIKKSENCIDYVVLHEIIHLIEPKHNKNFVRLLDKYLPKWLQFKQELNDGMLPHANWNL